MCLDIQCMLDEAHTRRMKTGTGAVFLPIYMLVESNHQLKEIQWQIIGNTSVINIKTSKGVVETLTDIHT